MPEVNRIHPKCYTDGVVDALASGSPEAVRRSLATARDACARKASVLRDVVYTIFIDIVEGKCGVGFDCIKLLLDMYYSYLKEAIKADEMYGTTFQRTIRHVVMNFGCADAKWLGEQFPDYKCPESQWGVYYYAECYGDGFGGHLRTALLRGGPDVVWVMKYTGQTNLDRILAHVLPDHENCRGSLYCKSTVAGTAAKVLRDTIQYGKGAQWLNRAAKVSQLGWVEPADVVAHYAEIVDFLKTTN